MSSLKSKIYFINDSKRRIIVKISATYHGISLKKTRIYFQKLKGLFETQITHHHGPVDDGRLQKL